MERQQEIDFSRAEQLGLIREAVFEALPAGDGKNVGSTTLKSVLRAIDDFSGGRGWAWPSFETLAESAGCSARSAKRAVQALESAGLLIVETHHTNHYVIVWTELAVRAEKGRRKCNGCTSSDESRSATGTTRSATWTTRSATWTARSATGTTRSATVAHKPPRSAQEPPTEPPPPTPSAAGGGWCDLIEEWRSRIGQIPELAHQAEADGEELEAFRDRLQQAWATATSPANQGRFRKPAGAVVHFLRRGCWPVEGVVEYGDEPAEQAAQQASIDVDERRRQREFESACRDAHHVVFLGRRQRATDDAISAALRRRFPPAVVEAIGWAGGTVLVGDEVGDVVHSEGGT